jgi:hypothetical protein
MQNIVGEKYVVPYAEIIMDDGRYYDIPIFAHLHADAQFGFPHQHYHIVDGLCTLRKRSAIFCQKPCVNNKGDLR